MTSAAHFELFTATDFTTLTLKSGPIFAAIHVNNCTGSVIWLPSCVSPARVLQSPQAHPLSSVDTGADTLGSGFHLWKRRTVHAKRSGVTGSRRGVAHPRDCLPHRHCGVHLVRCTTGGRLRAASLFENPRNKRTFL